MSKSNAGRPTVITPEILKILEDAFLVGATDLEACFAANIGKTTLYAYQQAHPEFTERKEELKAALAFRAKKNLAGSINACDVNDSKWYLERKKKDEFSTGANVNLGGQTDNPLVVTEIKRVIVDVKAENAVTD